MLARAKRDYYAVLGLPRTADRDSIKRAFRALAAEFHPDVSTDPEAEDRFREVAEAYEVLSRPDTRARYDRLGVARARRDREEAAPTRRDGVTPAGKRPRPGARGADVLVEAELGFVEAARGSARSVRFDSADLCPRCLGIGRLAAETCERCRGAGQVRVERVLHVRIPPGVEDGDEIRHPDEGHPGGTGGEAGDVVVSIRVAPMPDNPLVRRLAAAGFACAIALALAVVLLIWT